MPKGSVDKPAPRGGGPKERAAAAKKDIKAGRAPAGKPAPTAKEKPVGAKGRAVAARQEIKAGRASAGKPAPTGPARQKARSDVTAKSTGATSTPRGAAPTAPTGPTRPIPLPQGIQAKRPAGRGRVPGRGPTMAPSISAPSYNPGFPVF